MSTVPYPPRSRTDTRGALSHGGFRRASTRPEPSYRLLGDGAGSGVRVQHDGPVRPTAMQGGASGAGLRVLKLVRVLKP